MIRRRLVVGTATLAMVFSVAACSGQGATTGVAVGIVIDVEGDLSSVAEFTISTDEGERMTFVPAPDGEFAFPLPHLQDHVRSGDPVAVAWESEGEVLWAIGVDDAGDSPH